MALKRPDNLMATFSMASMTDVIFLLLIFFMVTSTFVFPTALEVNLPQSTQQTALKPAIRIYIDSEGNLSTVSGDLDPLPMTTAELQPWLSLAHQENPDDVVALYADEQVPYGRIVEILNLGAAADVKIVLATRPASAPVTNPQPTVEPDAVTAETTDHQS